MNPPPLPPRPNPVARFFVGLWDVMNFTRRLILNVLFFGLLLLVLIVFLAAVGKGSGVAPVHERTTLVIAPEGRLVEQYTTDPLTRAVARALGDTSAEEVQLRDLLRAIEAARDDKNIERVLLSLDNLQPAGMASTREVAQAQYDDRAKQPGVKTSEEAAKLEAAKAAYQRARAALEKALGGAPPEEIATLQTGIDQAELALTAARARLDETRLTAPFAGVVLDVTPRPGENVGAGAPLALLADVTRQHIEADVEEVDAPLVQAGQLAEVRLDAFPGQTLAATVTRLAPAATTRQGATSYTAWLDLAPTDLALKPGMAAIVRIATQTKPDALLVPARAVQNVGRQKIVRVVRDGRPLEVEVTTGLSDRQQVEILDGLREGDLVLVE